MHTDSECCASVPNLKSYNVDTSLPIQTTGHDEFTAMRAVAGLFAVTDSISFLSSGISDYFYLFCLQLF